MIRLINAISEKYQTKPLSRLEELVNKIKKIPELQHLFIDDPNSAYNICQMYKCKKFTHLLKCIILTSKYNFLNEYIDLYLSENPESINDINEKNHSALMIAARNSTILSTEETVEILLKHKADVNYKSKEGITALMCACPHTKFESSEKTVKMLIEYGANPNLKDNKNKTALDYSLSNIETCTISTVGMLMENMDSCDITFKNKKLIKYLWDDSNFPPEIIVLAIKKGANLNDINSKMSKLVELYQ